MELARFLEREDGILRVHYPWLESSPQAPLAFSVTESLTVGVLGGLGGVLMAAATFRPLLAMLPAGLPRVDEVSLDYRVLLFSLAISLAPGS